MKFREGKLVCYAIFLRVKRAKNIIFSVPLFFSLPECIESGNQAPYIKSQWKGMVLDQIAHTPDAAASIGLNLGWSSLWDWNISKLATLEQFLMLNQMEYLFSLVFGPLVLKIYKNLKVTYITYMKYLVCISYLKVFSSFLSGKIYVTCFVVL